jgi:hypothetical protein
MRRKLLALFGATAVALVGAVAFAAGPAQAATPAPSTAITGDKEDCLKPQSPEVKLLSFSRTQIALPCRQITFIDNCDETVTVNVANTADADSPFDVRFRIQLGAPGPAGDWVSKALNGGDSDSVTLAASDNEDIQVQSRYPAGVGPWLNFGDEHSWSWNASCLEVTSVSNCDGTFKVSVHNTSTEDGEFVWSLGLNDSTETKIEAGATLSENFTKGDIVQIRVGKDNEVVKTLEFVQPKDCATASPTPVTPTTGAPAPAPQPQTPDLPTTGDSLTKPAVTGVAAIALGLLIVGSMWLKRRRTGAEVSTEE